MTFDNHYNTQRKQLLLPEYGRHIHEMVIYIKGLPDREERNRLAKSLVNIMANMNPGMRENQEFRTKLWNHLAMMANFELDIDYPVEIIKKESLEQKPNRIPYNTGRIKYKHYGRNAERFIKKFAEMDDSETRTLLIEMLANHMKKLYLVWNKEAVSDEQIFSDMNEFSGSKPLVSSTLKLNETKDILFRNKKTPTTNPNPKKNHRSKK
jgi:hypothetical protein